MKAGWILVAIGAALALQTALAGFLIGGTVAVDLVLVAVVYVGLRSGRVSGLLAGTLAGLAQDALSSGIVGVSGLAKSLAGFLAGVVGTQFIVAQSMPRFVVFFGATLLNAAVFMGLYTTLDVREFSRPYASIGVQALANAAIGIMVFWLIEMLPGVRERRRYDRGRSLLSRIR